MSQGKQGSMELVVISDLHLSTGCPDQDGRYSCNEDFFFDEEFQRFLVYLQKKNLGKTHLVIAGDLFDFLQIHGRCTAELLEKDGTRFRVTGTEQNYGLGTEEDKAVWKLGVIAEGHKVFFRAISRFLLQGNCLSILAGNHDIELYWPKVQRALVDRLISVGSESARSDLEKRIHFYPWCYYDAEYKTYIEHGNQYDPMNAFPCLLYPVLARDRTVLWLPFGSFFVRYFFNKLESDHPFADNIKPATEYMRWAWRNDTGLFLDNIFRYLPLMVWLFLRGLRRSKGPDLDAENQRRIDALAGTLGLPSGKSNPLRKVYALKVKPHTWLWFLNPFAYATFFYIILFVVIFLALHLGHGSGFWSSLGPSAAALVIPLTRWLPGTDMAKSMWRWTLARLPTIVKRAGSPIARWATKRFGRDHLKETLPEIKRCFAEAEIDVQTIITGHTHDSGTAKVDATCKYFNTGTWTTVFSEQERLVRDPVQFTFVWLDKVHGEPRARLLRWNDNQRKTPPVILLGDRW